MARALTTAALVLFHNPSCSKSRGALGLLSERHVDVQVVEYLHETWTRESLDDLLHKLMPGETSVNPLIMMRTGDKAFMEMALNTLNPADTNDRLKLLDAMVNNPSLIERPIFVHGQRAVIGRPPEKVLELL
ncbi:arsenate reductase [Thraustotheca clavata]|uniref:Arsenate reductase n=1 Tax=Thraustotheca clavata TaxID=74557 RepID=A0A1V9ZZM4_9STRA|nr:arsenate reductase [Thraustotheca clavata]